MEMSEDGKTIIVGAPGTQGMDNYSGNGSNGISKGYINVFQYIEPVTSSTVVVGGGLPQAFVLDYYLILKVKTLGTDLVLV